MRRSLLILLATTAFAALLYVGLRTVSVAEPRPAAPPPAAVEPVAAAPIEPRASAIAEVAAPDAARSTAAVAPEPAAATTAANEAQIVGRVVDAAGAPVSDASVSLHSVDRTWAVGHTAPRHTRNGYELEGYEARTGPDGRFRVDAPVPTSDWISLIAEAGPFRGRQSRNFGPAGGRDEPRITAGVNDLGDLALTDCGSVRGTVRGADGSAIANAEVRLEGAFPGGLGVGTRTTDDGSFELGSVPPGTWTIGAKSRGWMSAQRGGVEVAIGRATVGFALELARAPTISGRVVDADGAPAVNVVVYGWPVGSGQGAGARTDAAGRFTLHLPQDEPYDLEITRQEEWSDWGESRSPAETFAPGTSDVRIVVSRRARVRFRVLDAESGAPIPAFTLALDDVPQEGASWNRFSMLPDPTADAQGEVELAATVGAQDVGVIAPGYAPLLARVAFDADQPGVQTLRLARESRLVAKLTRNGTPVAQASVRIERDALLVDPSADPEDMWAERRTDVDALAGRRRTIPVGADGVLRIGELAAGTYRITIDAPGVARHSRSGVVVAAGAELDLGTLELAAAAQIRGRIAVPAGASAIGLELRVDDRFDREVRVEAADGSFLVDGLDAGKHVLVLQRAPPLVVAELRREVELAAGATQEVVFDLVAAAPCTVELEIVAGGVAQAGLRLSWTERTDDGRTSSGPGVASDERGIARGPLPSGRPGSLTIATEGGRELHAIEFAAGLPAGGTHRERVELALGTLVVELPRDLALPEMGTVGIFLRAASGDDFENVQVHTRKHPMPFGAEADVAWTSHTLTISRMRPGEYVVALRASRMEADPDAPKGSYRYHLIHEAADQPLRIEAGKTATLDLRAP